MTSSSPQSAQSCRACSRSSLRGSAQGTQQCQLRGNTTCADLHTKLHTVKSCCANTSTSAACCLMKGEGTKQKFTKERWGLTMLPYPMVTRLVTLSQKQPSPRCIWLKSPKRSSEVVSCITCMPSLCQKPSHLHIVLAHHASTLFLRGNLVEGVEMICSCEYLFTIVSEVSQHIFRSMTCNLVRHAQCLMEHTEGYQCDSPQSPRT